MTKSWLRLGLYYHTPFMSNSGGLYMPGPFGRFVDSLASYCQQVVCFLHEAKLIQQLMCDYRIKSANVSCINLGLHRSVPYRTLFARTITDRAQPAFQEIDILLLRGPSPLLPALARSANNLPLSLLLVGDYLAGINELPQPFWRKELIRLWAYWNKAGQNRVAKSSLTFVNSRILFNELKDKVTSLHELRTTTVTAEDFYARDDTCQSDTKRLLYVGRMDRGKGLLEMVEALALLVEGGENVRLDFVGWLEASDPILRDIEKLASLKGVMDRVEYLGSRPLGPELFACYRASDIFLNASLASEGFPRTILEAMANSLPVVATRVGSIATYIEGVAELVPPRDIHGLADGISRMIRDSKRRQAYIRDGRKLAQGNTLEKRSQEMIEVISHYLTKTDKRT